MRHYGFIFMHAMLMILKVYMVVDTMGREFNVWTSNLDNQYLDTSILVITRFMVCQSHFISHSSSLNPS